MTLWQRMPSRWELAAFAFFMCVISLVILAMGLSLIKIVQHTYPNVTWLIALCLYPVALTFLLFAVILLCALIMIILVVPFVLPLLEEVYIEDTPF